MGLWLRVRIGARVVKRWDTIDRRVTLVLLATVVLTQFGVYLALRELVRGPAADLVATALTAELNRTLELPAEDRATLPMPFELRPGAPPAASAGRPVLPMEREIVRRLLARLPAGTEVRHGGSGFDRTLWIRPGTARGWVEVGGFSYLQNALAAVLLAALFGGLLVLIGAAVSARILTRPLRQLAEQAPALVLGRGEGGKLPHGPREVVALGRSLSETARRLAEAERERELLLAGISHDLRAPLARLRLRVELLDDPAAAVAMAADLDILGATVDSFISYVRDGRDEHPGWVELDEWLAELAEPYRERGLVLDLNLEGCRSRIRPLALKRAVVNLLENAFAHGRAPVSLDCRAGTSEIIIEVRDRGEGLSESQLERVRHPFETFDQARGSQHTGLGLAIVERIVRQHGGRLELANGPAGGLRATLRLPRDGMPTHSKSFR